LLIDCQGNPGKNIYSAGRRQLARKGRSKALLEEKKFQISITKSQGFRCSAGGGSGVRKKIEAET